MAEFSKVMEEMTRMCSSVHDSVVECEFCPLDEKDRTCSKLLITDPQKAERLIMNWANDNPAKLKPFWMVRVIKPNVKNTYFVEHSERFDHEPSEQEIAKVLVNNRSDKKSFANVSKNYGIE